MPRLPRRLVAVSSWLCKCLLAGTEYPLWFFYRGLPYPVWLFLRATAVLYVRSEIDCATLHREAARVLTRYPSPRRPDWAYFCLWADLVSRLGPAPSAAVTVLRYASAQNVCRRV